ncbi:hypothetical protein HOG47_05910 [archaeon]|nr:hypothetical protein [archaeon]MBT4272134.1 hypothetical protein [archaeon]
MHVLIHFIINLFFGFVLGFKNIDILIIALAGIIIDIDHIFYQVFVVKNKTIKQMLEWHKKENAVHRPHFYIFHMIDFLIIFSIISFYVNRTLFLISLGFILHVLADFVMYIFHYKSLNWIKYFFLVNYIRKKVNFS